MFANDNLNECKELYAVDLYNLTPEQIAKHPLATQEALVELSQFTLQELERDIEWHKLGTYGRFKNRVCHDVYWKIQAALLIMGARHEVA